MADKSVIEALRAKVSHAEGEAQSIPDWLRLDDAESYGETVEEQPPLRTAGDCLDEGSAGERSEERAVFDRELSNRVEDPEYAGFGINDLRREEEVGKAVKKIINLTNVAERSERSIREKLAKNEFSPESIDEAVAKAKRWLLIDDAHFAQTLIRSRISQGKGSVFIARDLRSNGIDPSTIPGWPDGCRLSEEEELERAIALLEKKPPHCKNLRDGAYRRLAQKGFPSSVASSAARIWYEGQAEEA